MFFPSTNVASIIHAYIVHKISNVGVREGGKQSKGKEGGRTTTRFVEPPFLVPRLHPTLHLTCDFEPREIEVLNWSSRGELGEGEGSEGGGA